MIYEAAAPPLGEVKLQEPPFALPLSFRVWNGVARAAQSPAQNLGQTAKTKWAQIAAYPPEYTYICIYNLWPKRLIAALWSSACWVSKAAKLQTKSQQPTEASVNEAAGTMRSRRRCCCCCRVPASGAAEWCSLRATHALFYIPWTQWAMVKKGYIRLVSKEIYNLLHHTQSDIIYLKDIFNEYLMHAPTASYKLDI